jgi:4-amino-4-deoxy-L-arabinose transferase-like glycosyltransferase
MQISRTRVEVHPGLAAAAALAALGAAVFAQVRLDAAMADPGLARVDVVLGFGAAILLWAVALAGRQPSDDGPDAAFAPARPGPEWTARRIARLAWGVGLIGLTAVVWPAITGPGGGGLGLLAYPGALTQGAADGANHLTLPGLVLWLSGIFFVAASLASPVRGRLGEALRGRMQITPLGVAVAAVTILALVYRVFDLSGVPPEMTSDHTEKLLDVRRVLDGMRPIFFWNNAGREPLQFYMTALLVKAGMPLAFDTLKFGMALVSTATVPVIFLVGRRLAGAETGLFAALIAALAPWHVQITRIGLRAAFSPFFVALSLLFFFRALDSGRRNDWLAAGAVAALGLYGYTGFRPMALVLLGLLALHLAAGRRAERRAGAHPEVGSLMGHLGAAALVGLTLLAPLVRFALDRPMSFFERTVTRLEGPQDPLAQFAENMKNGLLMFNATSDSWFHSPAGRPALETIGGALFVLGVLTALWHWRRGDWRLGALVPMVPLLILSSVMALAFPGENPSLTRAAGALVPVAILAALPLGFTARRLREAWGGDGTAVFFLLTTGLFVAMASGTNSRYFGEYEELYARSSHRTRDMGELVSHFLALGGTADHAYIVSWPHGPDYRAVAAQIGDLDWNGNLWDDASGGEQSARAVERLGHPQDPSRKLYIVGGPFAADNLAELARLYPTALVTFHPARFEGKELWSVLVPEGDGAPAAVAP